LETTGEYLNKNRTIPFKEIIPGDEVFIKKKKKNPKLSLKDPQSVEAHGGGGALPHS
jgi:hypothetical protein